MSDELTSKFDATITNLQGLWNEASKNFKKSQEQINSDMDKLRQENSELQKKYQEAQSKIDKIENQLQSTVEQLESLSKSKAKGIDAMQLLDIYLVLMENVFESQAETSLLLMLHGDKEEYKLEELTSATGISGVKVRQAVFSLRNAGVVEYNDETQVVKLVRRFL
jgi:seryl-tRNA synthetase